MRFVARNIRAISPLRWDLNSGQGVLTQFDTGTVGSRPQIVNDSGTAPADMSQLPPEELRKLKVRVCRHLHSQTCLARIQQCEEEIW